MVERFRAFLVAFDAVCITQLLVVLVPAVMLSTSGTELGQGLNTKVAQTVAYALGIDLSLISVTSTSTGQPGAHAFVVQGPSIHLPLSGLTRCAALLFPAAVLSLTEKIPNFSDTGGSGTSETTCAAALAACADLNKRLQPYQSKGSWLQVCAQCSAVRCTRLALHR